VQVDLAVLSISTRLRDTGHTRMVQTVILLLVI
jgi:hypothetical protein